MLKDWRLLQRRTLLVLTGLAVGTLVAAPGTARAQTLTGFSAPAQQTPSDSQPPATGAQASTLRAAIASSLKLLAIEHTFRVVFQEKTRRELRGNYFHDYVTSLRLPKTWEDGDPWLVNYVGHPIHGAAAGRGWLLNHPDADVEIGLSKRYWVSRAHATAWAAVYSVQFEFGPLSEAAIGNIGLRAKDTGWVDHVVTPAGALALIVAEDAIDKYLIQFIERRVTNRAARAAIRIALNPSRSFASATNGRVPWSAEYRASRVR
jgi:hypothetical protein